MAENSVELLALRNQVVDLQKKLSEQDELLKSAEVSKGQMTSEIAKLNELKQQVSEKDSVAKSTQKQLSDAKVRVWNMCGFIHFFLLYLFWQTFACSCSKSLHCSFRFLSFYVEQWKESIWHLLICWIFLFIFVDI